MAVIVRLMGGLGNQLFQYAAARGLAEILHTRVLLETSALQETLKRTYQLGAFGLSQDFYQLAGAGGGRWLRRLLRCCNPKMVRERHFHFDPEILELRLKGDVILEGYWQSEAYFRNSAGIIRKELAFRHPPANAANIRLLEEIASVPAVSLHFRRGDYVNDAPTQAFHGSLPFAYYETAMGLMAQRVPGMHLFVFSDDPAWVHESFRPAVPFTVVDINTADQPVDDLRLMASCRHHILANSSFSWWGAWLNPRSDKQIIAPQNWIRDPSVNTRDLIPEGWLRI